MKVKSALSPSRLPGLDYALNPYRGCGHGCVYCYAPDVLRMDDWQEWGCEPDVKENLPVVLAKELKKKKSGVVGLGTVTDPYQPIEAKTKITRYCLEQLAQKDWPVCIQTKSDLVLRDIDILSKMENVEVGFTLTTLDEGVGKTIEPNSSPSQNRVVALRQLSEAGIKTWVFLGPIVPTLNDSEESLSVVISAAAGGLATSGGTAAGGVATVGSAAADGVVTSGGTAAGNGASYLLFDKLRLRPIVIKRMTHSLGEDFARVQTVLKGKDWFAGIIEIVETECSKHGLECRRAFG